MAQEITSACSLVINPQGLVLSVSRRDNLFDFGLPGGKRERDPSSSTGNPRWLETPLQAAARETLEETKVVVTLDPSPIYVAMGRRYYCATYVATSYDDSEMSSGEEGAVKWAPFEELISGTFRDYNQRLLCEVMRQLANPRSSERLIRLFQAT